MFVPVAVETAGRGTTYSCGTNTGAGLKNISHHSRHKRNSFHSASAQLAMQTAERCISYSKSVRIIGPYVCCLSVRPSVTRWHCVKRLMLQSCSLHWRIAPWL